MQEMKYEAPEVFELGAAEVMTLGSCNCNCDCCCGQTHGGGGGGDILA